VALLGQPASDETRHLQLVLDDQHAHAQPQSWPISMRER
jgi:hypothetical protein